MTYLSEIVAGKQSLRAVSTPAFIKEFDVIVCGLGTAGSLAALFSAENGLSVLGIESFTCVGGTQTAGGVPGNYFGCPGGRYEVLEQEVKTFAQHYTCTTTESRKLLVENALTEQGAEVLYEASVCGVYLEENTVVGVRVLTGSGIVEYGVKILMDCTADAYIASMAGCATECGRKTDGQTQPYSIVSMVFDGQKYRYTNVDFGRVDQYDQRAYSEAVCFSRAYNIEACKASEWIAQMPLIGIREGRRIVAEENVRLEDVFEDRQTETPMFYSYADLDKHGEDLAFDGETFTDWNVGANLGACNVTVAIPYQAILPQGFDGLLVPCRAMGVDQDVFSCARMNLSMKKVAEVAAQWATLAIKQSRKLREVPYVQLKELLMKSGCLKRSDNRGCRIDGRRNWDGSPLIPEDICWITDPRKLQDRLKTEKPGLAIWSAKQIGARALPILRELLSSTNDDLKKHTAFALAILGSNEGNAILREMVVSRDGLMLKDCRKNNKLRGWMAIYWLGRLGDKKIAKELIGLICDPKEREKAVYRQPDPNYLIFGIPVDFNGIYFQFLSHAVMALVRIGNMHTDLRCDIAQAFKTAFSDDAYYSRITERPKESNEGNMTLTIKRIAFSAMEKWDAEK